MVLNTLPYPGLASKSANLFVVCSCSLATNPRESGPMLCPTCDIVFFLLNFSLNIPKKHHFVFYYYIQIQMRGPELGLSHISMKLFLFCVSILVHAFHSLYTYQIPFCCSTQTLYTLFWECIILLVGNHNVR